MKFPQKNSRGRLILQTLRAGALTIWQGIERHGNLATPARPEGLAFEDVLYLYCQLIDRGCMVRDGIRYRLTFAAAHRLAMLDNPPTGTSTATRREADSPKSSAHPHERTGRYRQLNFKLVPAHLNTGV
jgi:hypothetical protein